MASASSPGFGSELPKWSVSRVLFRRRVAPAPARIIHLGGALLRRSSAPTRTPELHLPGGAARTSRPPRCAYSSLLQEGLAPPPVTRLSRVGSYPTISPLPVPPRRPPLTAAAGSPAIGGVVSVALSLGLPRVAVSDLPALWSPDFPPAGGPLPPAGDPPTTSGQRKRTESATAVRERKRVDARPPGRARAGYPAAPCERS